MKFTDIFIERPVLAIVVSLLIFLFGLRSFQLLGVREYPKTTAAYINVQTSYPGASPELVQGFITTPLEKSIAQVDGIQYLESTSTQGSSRVGARLVLNYPDAKALTEVTERVNAVRDQLPKRSQNPTIDLYTNNATDMGYFAFYSDVLPPNKVTDYVIRAVQPKFSSIQGVQSAEIEGGKTFAMRIWLNPEKMAALGVDGATVRTVLANNNYLSAVGRTKGQTTSLNINASTTLHSAKAFKNLIVKHVDGAEIKLKDIARVQLGAETYDSSASYNGHTATFVGIKVAPDANPLNVMQRVTKVYPQIKAEMPPGMKTRLVYNAADYMHASINEVIKALGEALVIVIIVIFLFLGSLRSMIIPVIAMPLSLVGAGFIMQMLGFSINLLTLLAMVLAIGLVVDDAIIVVENIYRHIERGMLPKAAALQGARELGVAVIAMSITLAAVYAPISFVSGLTGTLFTQFAFTVAGAVIISGVIALTLSPMLCSKILKTGAEKRHRLVDALDRAFAFIQAGYSKTLHYMLDYRPVVAMMMVIIIASCYFLYSTSKHELAPTEDQGLLLVGMTASPNASFDAVQRWTRHVNKILSTIPAKDHLYTFTGGGPAGSGVNGGTAHVVLKPWGKRNKTQMQLQPLVQKKLDNVAGLQAVAFPKASLPANGGGLPVQVVVGTTKPPLQLYKVSRTLLHKAQQSGLLDFVENDLRYDKQQIQLHIDRAKAAALGLNMQQVGSDLAAMLGGNYVNYFSIQGRSYKVIPQVRRRFRLNAAQLKDYYINIPSGAKAPLSSMASIKTEVVPEQLKRYQQLNAADISGTPAPGVTVGQVIDWFQKEAPKVLPRGYSLGYEGASLAYVQQKSVLVITFFFALIVIYLVLAALFESFRDPLIILVSVPMSIAGALIFLSLGAASLNIYTEVGLITLIGLISKHGILIVRFANDLQAEGLSKRDAVEQAAGIRLRPILMTTLAMVFGVLPLVMASGAGAVSRFDIGLVIATGLTIGTPLTLFVVPTMYLYLGHKIAPQPQSNQPSSS